MIIELTIAGENMRYENKTYTFKKIRKIISRYNAPLLIGTVNGREYVLTFNKGTAQAIYINQSSSRPNSRLLNWGIITGYKKD